jgi:GNAT superfamily N-acetyltransferase
MLRDLTRADTAAALRLIRTRPLHNVFLEHVVRAGGLGGLPGFLGYAPRGSLEGILLVGPGGGTTLAVAGADASRALAGGVPSLPVQPRHIVGPEDTTVPFWDAYHEFGPKLLWERREPVYVVSRDTVVEIDPSVRVVPATGQDLEDVIQNSAQQYREDLRDDRLAADPEGFRRRHRVDVEQRRWWVLREKGRIVFQVHVGPENDRVVQIGGVFTVADRRNRGVAKSGVSAIVTRLLPHRPAVSLFCHEANAAACHVYESLGFQALFYYRSFLLADPS